MMGVETMARAKPKPGQQHPSKRIGLPTKERAAKNEIVEHATEQAGVMARKVLYPLDHLYARGAIRTREFLAGDKLRSDYLLGIQGARDPEKPGSGGLGYGPAQAQLDAATAYRRALASLTYAVAVIVDAIVCEEETLEIVARRRGVNPQEAKGYLRAGLETLADRYDIA